MYEFHDTRHPGFHRLTVVNGIPGKWDATENISTILENTENLETLYYNNITNRNYPIKYYLKKRINIK